MTDNKLEILLEGGIRVFLNKEGFNVGDLGLTGYNSTEKKHYMIPRRPILFIRSDEPFDESE